MHVLFLFLCLLFTNINVHTLLVIGHRGAAGYQPENTLASFEYAIQLGVDMIELDVHVCASGEVVVIHDQEVDRTTNGTGLVQDMTLYALQQLNAGNDEHIPTLQEVLDMVNRRVKVNIELKGKGTVEKVAAIIQDYVSNKGWQYDDFLISSFDHLDVGRFNIICPQVPIGPLFYTLKFADCNRAIARLSADIVIIQANEVHAQLVNYIHACGKKIYVFTNEENQIVYQKLLGVDAIFSDYPDRTFSEIAESYTASGSNPDSGGN
ncbi:MAG TPA: glycerophosphodiester phosphodiesterase family protein [Candidatus Dependentiae bacterium]|nr:glycerophosphodiester phosphodiesterase family protein [Candidatus Dependentiae bacterium]HRQ63234.1 glycerophosphodiester phosphodiesterase family protein [Candidatus Dependentiae bacterium]